MSSDARSGEENQAGPADPDAPRGGPSLSYIPALDGIRGVAIIVIMGYHGGVFLTSGGFYSLDTFFALSGFLITSLLISEWQRTEIIRLGRLLASTRFRRLLPALLVMLLGVTPAPRRLRGAGRHVPDPTGGRDLRALLLRQLALHRDRLELLRPDRADVAGDPYLVARRRRAVLSDLATGLPGRLQAVEEHTGLARGVRRRRPRLGDRDGGAVLARRRQSPVLRHRHAGAVAARRGRPGHGPLVVG